MGFVSDLLKVAAGAVAGVTGVTVLPFLGAVGVITAASTVVGSVIGGAAEIMSKSDD